jgi:hypothetical protein
MVKAQIEVAIKTAARLRGGLFSTALYPGISNSFWTNTSEATNKPLVSLARPTGIEPVFSP